MTLVSIPLLSNPHTPQPHSILWASPASLATVRLLLTQPATGLSVPLYEGPDKQVFDWVAGTAPDGAPPIPPGGGYQLVLLDADSRVGNATSPLFSIFSAQPSVRILSILDGAFFWGLVSLSSGR